MQAFWMLLRVGFRVELTAIPIGPNGALDYRAEVRHYVDPDKSEETTVTCGRGRTMGEATTNLGSEMLRLGLVTLGPAQ